MGATGRSSDDYKNAGFHKFYHDHDPPWHNYPGVKDGDPAAEQIFDHIFLRVPTHRGQSHTCQGMTSPTGEQPPASLNCAPPYVCSGYRVMDESAWNGCPHGMWWKKFEPGPQLPAFVFREGWTTLNGPDGTPGTWAPAGMGSNPGSPESMACFSWRGGGFEPGAASFYFMSGAGTDRYDGQWDVTPWNKPLYHSDTICQLECESLPSHPP